MTIVAGDKVPAGSFKIMGEDGPVDLTTSELFTGKKVVVFGVPGAFTPGCSRAHLPGYVANADRIKAMGVDTIACLAVNDAYVLDAWTKSQNAGEILMLADGSGDYTRALGLELDVSHFGMGSRCKRFAMIVEDGTVKHLAVEPSVGVQVSSAEQIMEKLGESA